MSTSWKSRRPPTAWSWRCEHSARSVEQRVHRYLDSAARVARSAEVAALLGWATHSAKPLNLVGQESRRFPVAVGVIYARGTVVIADGNVHMEPAPRPGDGDVEQPPLLVDALRRPRGHAGREVPVVKRKDVHRLPFQALGGVHR